MANFAYQHDQWLFLALGGGVLLVLFICLGYLAGWRPRPPAGERPVPASQAALQYVPWVLIVVYLIIFIYYLISPFLWLYWPEQWG